MIRQQAIVIGFVENLAQSVRLQRYALAALQNDAWLICADSGAEAALAWGLRPDYLVGDMDSISPATLAELSAYPATKVIRLPAEKDETDLEIALYTALDLGATDITILGGLGGRLDHTLGNLYLLAAPRLAEGQVRVKILAEDSEIYLLRGGETLELSGEPGNILSLIPFSAEARGIRTEGLYYPLRSETLLLGPTRGVSNVFTAPVATVSFDQGLLLVIHTFSH
ncbi:MAG TPA: thiamine diphosphokinase [Chloroflexia bacterium]|nr:thiamine diphosphokinase [Chloroflexia bacterium]